MFALNIYISGRTPNKDRVFTEIDDFEQVFDKKPGFWSLARPSLY